MNRETLWIVLTAILLMVAVTACDTWSKPGLKVPDVSQNAFRTYKTTIDKQKGIVETRYVHIEAQDIQLPLTSGKFDPQENRTYSFYVWAFNPNVPGSIPVEQMLADGTFNLEVVGVKASIRSPEYVASESIPSGIPSEAIKDQRQLGFVKSRNVLEVQVRSVDVAKPFSIIAWFPAEYQNWMYEQYQQAASSTNLLTNRVENPWGEKRDVKVYNGDLRTRIEIVDEREAESSFGRVFAKYFYVGRVYLRNRHTDKRMVVYTTSMKANLLMYRPPVPEKRKQHDLEEGETKQLNQDARRQRDEAMKRLSSTEARELLKQALATQSSAGTNAEVRSDVAGGIVRRIVPDAAENATIRQEAGVKLVQAYWDLMRESANSWQQESKRLAAEAAELAQNEMKAAGSFTGTNQAANLAEALVWIAEATNATSVYPAYNTATNIISKSNTSLKEQQRLLDLARRIYRDSLGAYRKAALATALRHDQPEILASVPTGAEVPDGGGSLRIEFEQKLEWIRYGADGQSRYGSTPFAHIHDILLNPEPRPLAFSEDSDRQRQLAEVGYLWRDTYRPMTFQAVLNSLIHTHESSLSSRTMAILQATATVAGGMVGLGSVINEFSSEGYLVGVNLFSTIFVPSVGKLILDDLNKQIRNLGEMGMDTVVVVPPNDVVDRYIFFPKGPIYNFVDEFNVNDPAYIKGIDNDDLAVEATLIDQGVNVRGGGLSSTALVDRALNEGKADSTADLLKQADMQDRLRRFELATMASRIEAKLAGTQPADTNGVKSPKRLMAEREVCQEIASFKLRFGEDSTGVLIGLQSKFGIYCQELAPSVLGSAIPKPRILAGVPSRPFQLFVSDPASAPWLLRVGKTSRNPDRLPEDRIQIKLPQPGEVGPISFTVEAAPSTSREEVSTAIEFSITNMLDFGNQVQVPVTIEPAKLDLLPGEGATLVTTNLTLTEVKPVLEVRMPIYDSQDSPDLKIQADSEASNNWVFTPEQSETVHLQDGTPARRLFLSVDCSMGLTNNAVLSLTASMGTNVLYKTNLWLSPPAGGGK